LELESLPESGIEFAGISNQLKNEYSDAAVVINPLLFGSGLKIKSIEAVASGRALVATKVGVEGLEEEFGKAFVVTEFENMYAEIALLLTDYAMRRKYEIRASLLLQERFSPEACFASLKVCLDSLEDKIY
jgi:succinoglycan biosynthesis protein ExoO